MSDEEDQSDEEEELELLRSKRDHRHRRRGRSHSRSNSRSRSRSRERSYRWVRHTRLSDVGLRCVVLARDPDILESPYASTGRWDVAPTPLET